MILGQITCIYNENIQFLAQAFCQYRANSTIPAKAIANAKNEELFVVSVLLVFFEHPSITFFVPPDALPCPT